MLILLLAINPLIFLLVFGALVLSISIHEFAHAYSADKLGDPTARYLGRVTLNPAAHLDPIGTILLVTVGFGWGRPVPFNPANLDNPKRDSAIISFAGPLSNFLLAGLMALINLIFPQTFFTTPLFGGVGPSIAGLFAGYNLVLGIFNMIPIEPLDGFKIVYGLLPWNLAIQWEQLRPYGIYLLLLMVVTGATGNIIAPIINTAMTILGFPPFL